MTTSSTGRTRSRVRTAWRTTGAVVTVVVLVLAGLALWTWTRSARTEDRQYTYRQPVSRIQVDSNGGDITVVAGDPGAVSVQRRLVWTSIGRPAVTETWTGDTLDIRGRCPWSGLGGDCTIAYTLRVPAGVSVELRTEAGSVRVRDLTGDVRLTSATGDVTADNTAGPLRVRAGNGTITGTGLRSNAVDVQLGAGDVRLSFARPGTSVSAVSGRGDVDIALAAGPYRVDADAGNGRQTVDVTQDPRAPTSVTARTGSGDIHIRYTG